MRWASRSTNLKNRERFGIVRENISIDKRRGNNIERKNFIANYTYYDENGNIIKLRKKSIYKEVVENWLHEMKLLYPIII